MCDTPDSQGDRLAHHPQLKFMNLLGIHNSVLDPIDIKKSFKKQRHPHPLPHPALEYEEGYMGEIEERKRRVK